MSDTKKHKENAKFRKKCLDIDEVSIGTRKGWYRHNSERGYFKNLKNIKIEKIQDFETDNEMAI